MKKKIFLFCLIALLFTGCTKKEDIIISEQEKNYSLEQKKLDCNLTNITFVDNNYIFANNQIYKYSINKKFSDSNSNCKIIVDDISNYKYIGVIYIPNVDKGLNKFFYNNKIYSLYDEGLVELEDDLNNVYWKNIIDPIKDNDIYYYNNGFYYTDKIINLSVGEDNQVIPIPENEKIIYANPYGRYIFTDKKAYITGIDKNDKCNEYEDIKCTYTLIETNNFNDFLSDFKNNISYFNGEYLVTKNNEIYFVRFNF